MTSIASPFGRGCLCFDLPNFGPSEQALTTCLEWSLSKKRSDGPRPQASGLERLSRISLRSSGLVPRGSPAAPATRCSSATWRRAARTLRHRDFVCRELSIGALVATKSAGVTQRPAGLNACPGFRCAHAGYLLLGKPPCGTVVPPRSLREVQRSRPWRGRAFSTLDRCRGRRLRPWRRSPPAGPRRFPLSQRRARFEFDVEAVRFRVVVQLHGRLPRGSYGQTTRCGRFRRLRACSLSQSP